ncbi:hypothetical protein H0E87_007630, partial [Populus deltoides]
SVTTELAVAASCDPWAAFLLGLLQVCFCLISAGYWLLCSLPTMCLLLGPEGWLSFVLIDQAAFSLIIVDSGALG